LEIEHPIDRAINLVTNALDEIDSKRMPVSSIIRKAIRIARMRNDYESLYWLEYEMIGFKDKHSRDRLRSEIALHFDKQSFNALRRYVVEAYISERQIAKMEDGKLVEGDFICGLSVHEIEVQVDHLIHTAEKAVPPEGLHPVDLYYVQRSNNELRDVVLTMAQENQKLLARIVHRVYDFLSASEQQLVYGQFHSDV
jgi:hypothetical protein